MLIQRPWLLQLGNPEAAPLHDMYWQAAPKNPDRHAHPPVTGSHTPMFEHCTNWSCPLLSAEGYENLQ
jgi:hypothetical protein